MSWCPSCWYGSEHTNLEKLERCPQCGNRFASSKPSTKNPYGKKVEKKDVTDRFNDNSK